ncbi:phosphohydrolase [Planctomycetales bacterium]|nr:phosphohydrolase [Planctomycetales bacterium]GHT46084.1 phosphohydrolase [Planctomycetales bacterium]
MNNSAAREELQHILVAEQLPAMPQSALSILKLDNDLAKININDLVRPIEADPGLAAQVLKFLNSSAFGFQSAISNIRQGIALVGIRIVKNFVLWKAIFSLIPKSKNGSFDIAILWQDSLRRAMFARYILLEIKRGDPEMAFAGALLQDMAVPLLLKLKAAEYSQVLNTLTTVGTKRLSVLEQEKFGWDHSDAGFVLGQQWKLPELLTSLIGSHLRVQELCADFAQCPEGAIVAISALLPTVTKNEWDEQDSFWEYFTSLFPNNARLASLLFDRVDREFDSYAELFMIQTPKRSLFSYMD